MALSDWLFARHGQTHGIALPRLSELLFEFLIEHCGRSPSDVAEPIWRDYQRGGRSDRPAFLRELVPAADTRLQPSRAARVKRQQRHLQS
jgi:hypothetical protein